MTAEQYLLAFVIFYKGKSSMRIAIIGAGGVGGYLGAKLWKVGNEVIFVARGNHLTAMRQNGLRLESPDGSLIVHSTFTDRLDKFKPFDLIIIGVKSFNTKEAAKLALPVLKDNSIVLSIQNGVENEKIIARSLGNQHVLGGVAYIFSTIGKPGVIRHEAGSGKFKFGEMDGIVSDRCKKLVQVFKDAGIKGEAVDNISRSLWEKWIFICGLSGMTAYARKPIGDILADASLNSMLQEVVSEAASISRAKGIDKFTNVEEKMIAHYRRLPHQSTSSMYYDLINGKRVEVEALNGAVVRFGNQYRIPTPINKRIYDELKRYA
jgi:2-dehydropantoate 2-reductase